MASAPLNKPNPTPGKPSASAGAAAGEKNRKNTLITAASAVLALGLLIGYFVWRSKANTPPPLNDSTTVLVKFASSDRFEKLPFDEQKRYMVTLDDRGNEMEAAYKKGQLSEAQLRLGKELAWFGKQLDRMDRYYSEGPAGRNAYIAKLAEKKVKKEIQPGSTKKQADEDEDIDRDETSETLRPQSWPKDVQAKWNEFRDAYRAARKAKEEALKPAAGA